MPDPTPPPADETGELPEPTAEQEAALSRLLAESGGPEPVPAEVAARLDATLADLRAERADAAPVSTGVAEEHGVVLPRDALAARRRRKTRILLAAAAVAVVVAAVGAGQLTDRRADDMLAGQSAEEDPARTADSGGGQALQESGAATADATADEGSAERGDDTSDHAAPSVVGPMARVTSDAPLRVVRRDRLREDLVALQHVTLRDGDVDYSGRSITAPQDFMCEPADFGAGHLVAVEYAGRPAVVAFRAPAGSTQEADVLACGTGDTLHSVTLATAG